MSTDSKDKSSGEGSVLAELLALGTMALPLVGAQLAQMGMGLVDTVMTGRLGAVPLAAVALGNSVWNPLFLFSLGVLLSFTATVAPLVGAGRLDEIGHWLRQSLWLAILLAVAVMWIINQASAWLPWIVSDAGVIVQASDYLAALSLGVPAFFVFLVFRGLCESFGRTRPILLITLLGLAINIVSNYALIFGRLGAPALGATGCGLATSLTYWVMLLGIIVYVWRHRRFRDIAVFGENVGLRFSALGLLLQLGLPIGMAIFLESGLFASVALLVGNLGPVVLAGHQIALNVVALTFMVPLGISQATTVRVGQALGRGSHRDLRLSGYCGIAMAVGAMVVMALIIAGGRGFIVGIYTPDQRVQAVAMGLLLVGALFQISDGAQIGAAGALRGLRDTRFAMVLSAIGYWVVSFPVALLGTRYWMMGVVSAWWALALGVSVAAVGLIWRFKVISKKMMI